MNHSDPEFTSVWDALEDTPAEAENMRIRSILMMAIAIALSPMGCHRLKLQKILM